VAWEEWRSGWVDGWMGFGVSAQPNGGWVEEWFKPGVDVLKKLAK